jgi:Xaa-Pro aminopeptidase
MKYSQIDRELFIRNRKKFVDHLSPKSMAIFNSNDILPTNADGTMNFRQNNDLFYLSGIDQEESILVIFPDFPNEEWREILFLKETSEEIAIWEGEKYTKEAALSTSGIRTVYWLDQFETVFNTMMADAETVYLNTNEHIRAKTEVETRDARFIKWCKEKYPVHNYKRSAPVMHTLRAVKDPVEVDVMQKACNITEKGFRRILEFVKPGVIEYEIEAEFAHEFLRHGSRGFAYTPIVASGPNACVLHYIQNNQPCKDGDVILLDIGAEYGNYNADMSRSIPVNGKFTKRQKQVYNSVLKVQREAMKILRPGTVISDYQKEVEKLMESELLELGLLDKSDIKNQDPKNPAVKKYFMHGTSHHIGLDVHDVANVYQKVVPGMVFTVEPGIYIREEGLGIRLENNIVIREEGWDDLMENIPIEAEEIEDLMNKS